jgi:ROS/MUCR transcriptional regulator protein
MTQTIFDTETLDRLNKIYSSRKSRKSDYILENGDLEFIDSCIPMSAFGATTRLTHQEKLNWVKKKLPIFLIEQYKMKNTPTKAVMCLVCGFYSRTLFGHISKAHNLKVAEYKQKYGKDSATASEDYLTILSDRVKGSNNPAYQHGGKFSPYSKKFIKYQELTDEEKLIKVSEVVGKSNTSKTPDKMNCRVEYYMAQGMNLEDANRALAERQSTFNLELCVEKHGILAGVSMWQERQNKWQDSLKTKSQDETRIMNEMKSVSLKSFILRFGDNGLNEYIKMCNMKDWKYFTEIQDLNEFLSEIFTTFGYTEKSITRVSEYQFGVFGIVDSLEYCKLLFVNEWGTFPTGLRQTRNTMSYYYDELDSYGNHVVLRSSIEKKMHTLLVENNINFLCEHQYPNSILRYDFTYPIMVSMLKFAVS